MSPLMLLIPGVAAQAVPVPDIVVTADRGERRRIERRVAALSAMRWPDRPLARFHDPVCVQSAGLPPAANRAIEARVRSIAHSVALRSAGAGCVPNVTVLFVADAREAFDRLSRSRPLPHQTLADIRRIRSEPVATRVWIDTEIRSRDGDRPSYSPDAPAILSTAMSTRLSSPVRHDIVGAVLLIDRDRVADVPLVRVADHVAYRALAGISSIPPGEECSVLSLFDSVAAAGMTRFDRAYLDALYRTRSDLPPAMQRQAIATEIRPDADPSCRVPPGD